MTTQRIIRTPDQRLRVFVSSTLQELADERVAAKNAITKLRLSPVLFELGARPHPAQALYRAYLEQSHVFIGIYWQRYGWVAPDMSVSGLEDEYRLSGQRPKLIYVKTPAPEREPRLKQLLDEIKNDAVSYKPFASAAELQQLIEEDLSLVLTESFEAAYAAPDTRAMEAADTSLRLRFLPTPVSTLIGREQETGEIAALLTRGDVRLVTLTGPGGVGKTRLSLEVARRLQEGGQFADGVCFVPLAAATTDHDMTAAIAQAIGLRETGPSASPQPLFDRVSEGLRDRQALLVLDNFEQAVASAPLLADLLAAAPQLEILVSSRTVLRLSGEYEYEVAPLAVPDPEHDTVLALRDNGAVRLFVERARASKTGFELTEDNASAIAAICRRLDGLPLAIELAAARIGLLTPQTLLSHLEQSLNTLNSGRRDAPERQRTLRHTIDWSHSLLEPQEQIMFARFAVFSGGCVLDAAEHVLNLAPIDSPLDVLTGLVDKSLIYLDDQSAHGEQHESRLMMLQTIREYALEKLDERGEFEVLRASHTRYFEQLVCQAESELNSSTESRWLARLGYDRDNLRAALEWLLRTGQAEAAAGAAWTLWQFWVAHSNLREWQQWTAEMLNGLPDGSGARAKALVLAGGVAAWQGDYARGVPLLEEGVALFERLGERNHAVSALMTLGIALMNKGDLERASQVLSRGLAGDV